MPSVSRPNVPGSLPWRRPPLLLRPSLIGDHPALRPARYWTLAKSEDDSCEVRPSVAGHLQAVFWPILWSRRFIYQGCVNLHQRLMLTSDSNRSSLPLSTLGPDDVARGVGPFVETQPR